jgi:hypothetical protein
MTTVAQWRLATGLRARLRVDRPAAGGLWDHPEIKRGADLGPGSAS